MPAIFRRKPDLPATDYTQSHQGRGEDYQQNFARRPGRATMWELEQEVLCRLVPQTNARSIVDFACGTGRITEFLVKARPAARVVGVDVAETMLDSARSRVPAASFVNASDRALSDLFRGDSVDLIVAFRFFSNAEPALRESVADQFASILDTGGFVIANNHRNFWSSSYIARRFRSPRAPGYLNADFVDLFRARGFEVVRSDSLGVMPQSDDRSYLAPWSVTQRIERWNARRVSTRHRAGLNTIWLLRKVS